MYLVPPKRYLYAEYFKMNKPFHVSDKNAARINKVIKKAQYFLLFFFLPFFFFCDTVSVLL